MGQLHLRCPDWGMPLVGMGQHVDVYDKDVQGLGFLLLEAMSSRPRRNRRWGMCQGISLEGFLGGSSDGE